MSIFKRSLTSRTSSFLHLKKALDEDVGVYSWQTSSNIPATSAEGRNANEIITVIFVQIAENG